MDDTLNVARHLVETASQRPGSIAIAEPIPKRRTGEKRDYKITTFAELDHESDTIARSLVDAGLAPGMKIVLMVRQGRDFVSLFYALLKAGAVVVLIDPGMGMRRMLDCLEQARPDGFAALAAVHAVRCLFRRRFPDALHNLTVGHRWFWGGLSLAALRRKEYGGPFLASTGPDDPAAIIFTSGSTGTPKGVLYTHRMFETQVREVAARYDIQPGGIDLAGFPFFGLFNAAMGTTAVIPEMDPTRPGRIDPRKFLEAADDWKITQSFGSPALWRRVADYCIENDRRITTLRRCISAGAPIHPKLLESLQKIIAADGEIFTPYGATEALPIASIGASEVLGETVHQTNEGGGICVGTRFGGVCWKVIAISEHPIATLEEIEGLPRGAIGELLVGGPQVSRRYVTGEADANARAKIIETENGTIWHRMGDVGYLDDQDRFWFCGRKGHRVVTEQDTLFSIPSEAVFNRHPKIYRSALAGASYRPVRRNEHGEEIRVPWMFLEPYPRDYPRTEAEYRSLLEEMRRIASEHALTRSIAGFTILEHFPVDVRHNAKINREKLSEEAGREFSRHTNKR